MKTILRIPLSGLDFISSFDLRINFFNLKSLPLLVLTACRYGVDLDRLNSTLICGHCDTNIVSQSRKRKIFISDLNCLSKKFDQKRVVKNCEDFGSSINIKDLLFFNFNEFEFFVGEGEHQFSYSLPAEIELKEKIVKDIDYSGNENVDYGKIKRKKSKYECQMFFKNVDKNNILNGYCDNKLIVDEAEAKADLKDEEFILNIEKTQIKEALETLESEKSSLPQEKKIVFKRSGFGRDARSELEKMEYDEYEKLTEFVPKSKRYESKLGNKILEMWPSIKDEVLEIKNYVDKHGRYPNDLKDCKLPNDFMDYPDFYVNNCHTLQEDYLNLKRISEVKENYEVQDLSYKRTLLSNNRNFELKNEIKELEKEFAVLEKKQTMLNNKKSVFECLYNRRSYVEEKRNIEDIQKQLKHIELSKKRKKFKLDCFPEIRMMEKFPLSKNPYSAISPGDDFYDEFDLLNEGETDVLGIKEVMKTCHTTSKNIILDDYNKAFNVLVQVKNPEKIFTNVDVWNENQKLITNNVKTCGENKIPKRTGRFYFTLLAKMYSLLRNKCFIKNIDKYIHKVRGCSIKYAMKSLISVNRQVDVELLSNYKNSTSLNLK